MKKGVAIFDLSDTLVSTTAVWREAYCALVKELGIHMNAKESRILEEKGVNNALEALMDYHRVPYTHSELMLKLARYAIADFNRDATLMSGASEAVCKMRDDGYYTAVITNANNAFSELAKKKFFIELPMDGWYNTREMNLQKDDIKLYDKIASDFGVDVKSCILFDNSEPVIRSVAKMGLSTVYISDKKIKEAKYCLPSLCALTQRKVHTPTRTFVYTENLLF